MLIILSKSINDGSQNTLLNIVAESAKKDDKIVVLHIQDACTAATSSKYCDRLLQSKIRVYALKPDIEARGLNGKICAGVKIVDYKQWVDLLIRDHSKIISWTS